VLRLSSVCEQDEDDALTSRESRVADFISGVTQTQVTTSSNQTDAGLVKYEYIVHDVYDAHHFFSHYRIVKNSSSGHGFVI